MTARCVGAVLIAFALGGCVIPQAEVAPEGTLEVFGVASLAPGPALPRDWALDIEDDDRTAVRNAILVERQAERATLTLHTARRRFVLARRTNATLLATPYLGWSWRFMAAPGYESDIRMIVAFHGGNPESRSWGGEPFAYLGLKLPPFDRAIAVLWGRSALERGSLATGAAIAEYIARGGSEHQDAWWSDNLDLAALYRKAWPDDRIERARIMFVGFAVAEGAGDAQASFGDIVLYR
jgi:hypothetical protein